MHQVVSNPKVRQYGSQQFPVTERHSMRPELSPPPLEFKTLLVWKGTDSPGKSFFEDLLPTSRSTSAGPADGRANGHTATSEAVCTAFK